MWQVLLQDIFVDFADWQNWSEKYGLHARLGYDDPQTAWDENPIVQGSVNPDDYSRV